MTRVLATVAALAAVVALSWALLAFAARRLPPGLLRDLATSVPAFATLLRRLARDRRVPRRVKLAVLLAAAWVVSPVDLVPEFVPILGPLDDVVVVVLVLRWARRRIPRHAIEEAWPGDPRILDRLLAP